MMDLTGLWLGTYWQDGQPTRFEATFVQSEALLSGRITDDGYLGDAQISGQVTGRFVRFTKSTSALMTRSITQAPFRKRETRSGANGFITLNTSGPWEAHRSQDSLLLSLQTVLQQQLPLLTSGSG
ncbi:MAG: hypothetical protein HC921_22050 [Synechococcaceae cyanobacterium SM2_3_1]|nr:hypothetical protein [Synechococcaceae cyanobacterium SM2_3_1]